SKVLNVNLSEKRAVNYIQSTNPFDIGQGWNVFDPPGDGFGKFQRSVQGVDQQAARRRIDRWVVCADDDFFFAVTVDIADDWRCRQERIRIRWPAGMVDEFDAVPISIGDLVRMVEAEDVDVVVVVGIDGNEGRGVEPAEIVRDVDVRKPASPENRAVVV